MSKAWRMSHGRIYFILPEGVDLKIIQTRGRSTNIVSTVIKIMIGGELILHQTSTSLTLDHGIKLSRDLYGCYVQHRVFCGQDARENILARWIAKREGSHEDLVPSPGRGLS